MACSSCGGGGSARVGSTINTAIIFGDPTNEVIRVRVDGDVAGIQRGAIKYVRGTNVAELLDDGTLIRLAGSSRMLPPLRPGTSLYYVGGVGYPDMASARVRSGQTGEDIVVRTLGATP